MPNCAVKWCGKSSNTSSLSKDGIIFHKKVHAQRKFAQGAHIPHHLNSIERRGEGHDKPAAPPTIVHNMSATSLLDQISFQSIHVHEKKLQPVVRLERLTSPQKVSTAPRVPAPGPSTPQKLGLQQRMARPVASMSSPNKASSLSKPLALQSIRARLRNSIPETSALSRKARFKNRTHRQRPLGLRQHPAPRPMSPYTRASTPTSMPLAWLTTTGCKPRVPTPRTKRLKRLESTVLSLPRVRAISPLVTPPATPLSFLARNRAKERVLTNGISKSRVAVKKKLKKVDKRLRASRRLRVQREASRCTKDETDTEDDTPLTLLAKSKTKTGPEASSPQPTPENSTSHPGPEASSPQPTPENSRSRPGKLLAAADNLTPPDILQIATKVTNTLLPDKSRKRYDKCYEDFISWKTTNEPPEPQPVAVKHIERKNDKKEGYYCADNIVRWLSNNPSPFLPINAPSGPFKVPLPPKDRRSKRPDPPTTTPVDENRCTFRPISASIDSVDIHAAETIKLYEDNKSEFERPPSSCPSERYVTVRDVVSASTEERQLRCRNCKHCSCADKVEKLSKVVETNTEPNDVYEFDAERDGEDDSSKLLREFRSRHARPGHTGISEDVCLDIGSSNNQHIILITPGNHKNKTLMQAQIIKNKDVKSVSEYKLVENEKLFDQLIEIMEGIIPSLQKRKEFNEPSSPSPSEITEVNYQTTIPETVATSNEEKCQDKSLPGRSKIKTKSNSSKRFKSMPNRTASSKIVEASTSERAMRSSKVTITSTRPTKTTTEKTRSRHTPYTKTPATRLSHTASTNASGSQPLTAATPVAGPSKTRVADDAVPGPSDNLGLPKPDPKKPAAIVREAPVYYPSEEEFNDPIAYFENIMPTASKFGICKVVAPASFKPKFSIHEKIRFNVANQYIARLYIRWGQASKEMCAIKAHLASQRVAFTRAPIMDNLEVDLPKLYRTVQRLGGLKKVIEKKRWGRVAEEMRFLKGTKLDKKLDELYVKYLLPYDTLSSQERESIKLAVNKAWHKKNERIAERAADPLHRQKQLLGECQSSSDTDEDPEEIACALTEAEDCIVPGRRMTLNIFARVAKAVQDTYFPNTPQPTPQEVEAEYWRIVLLAAEHICVNTASIDTGDDGFGFSKNRNDPFGRHPWNLKMISQNPGNVLHMLGRVLGVTVPTLHLGMVFSTSCWHRDPHGLPWIEYMHSGPAKIWYGIPDEQSSAFRKAVATLCPTACQNKSIWLPSDITMIPPNFLLSSNVSLTRVEQKPNEYIIVFPKAYSSSISTGHTTSESVYFATKSWLKTVDQVFQELRGSCEPTMFALEQLLIAVASDPRAHPSLLQMVHTTLASIVADEKQHRLDLTRLGVPATTATRPPHKKKPNGAWNVREQDECEVCRSTLYLSKVTDLPERDSAVCLNHALLLLKSKKQPQFDVSQLSLVVYLTEEQLDEVMANLQNGFVPIR